MNTLMNISSISPHSSRPVSLYWAETQFLVALGFNSVTSETRKSNSDGPQGVFTKCLWSCCKSMPATVSCKSEELCGKGKQKLLISANLIQIWAKDQRFCFYGNQFINPYLLCSRSFSPCPSPFFFFFFFFGNSCLKYDMGKKKALSLARDWFPPAREGFFALVFSNNQ